MPEGHSIRRLANKWEALVGEKLKLSSPQGRFSDEAKILNGLELVASHAHGKHLFLEFENEQFIHVHLGLYGRFLWHKNPAPDPTPATRLRAVHSAGAVDLSGPTACQLISIDEKQAIHDRLGPDPLQDSHKIDPALPWLKQSKWPVGRTILDQSKIAGIGNVYRAEILFILAMDPWRLTSDLSTEEWQKLWTLSRDLLKAGTSVGRIITTDKKLPPPATLPPGTACASRTYVYKRTGEPCLACATPIESTELGSRTLYWCPTCQA